MRIVLMRHGKPKIDKNLWVNAGEFGAWVKKYNAAGIDTECPAPQFAIEQANQCAITVCSNLPRSLESAKALGIERVGVCDPMFREMDMPHARWRFPRLSLMMWSVFFRLAWVLGYSANAEPFKAAKERARHCAENLANLASVHGSVLLVGHGSLNWFIAKYLNGMGWLCLEKSPRKYWGFSAYHTQAT
ncbi:MAG TPA: histidine phosphatase family protein [Gallionella sp.]|nr:histidine phosphatase family protein [Gallionella sp.]